jgi:hypothetical protein
LLGEIECFGDDIHLFAVFGVEIGIDEFLEPLVDHLLVRLFVSQFLVRHFVDLLFFFGNIGHKNRGNSLELQTFSSFFSLWANDWSDWTPSGRGLFISLFPEKKRNEPKRKFAGCICEAKNRIIFPKTAKRASLGRGRFFTEKSSDFLHASPKRPELFRLPNGSNPR